MTFVETGGMLTPARCAWQKQEVLKGIDLLFGTLDGGWGFHCWTTMVSAYPPVFKTKHYTAEEANAMVQNGSIVTHPVFDRGESAMFSATISESDINHILAYNIPAILNTTGKGVAESKQFRSGRRVGEAGTVQGRLRLERSQRTSYRHPYPGTLRIW